jgi:hypothetical protein
MVAGQWQKTANRGFYYGHSSNTAWNNDRGWVDSCVREDRQANRYFMFCFGLFEAFSANLYLLQTLRFAEQQLDSPESRPGLNGGSISGKASSRVTSSSRDSLYKHFDKLTKEEQVMVLKDAIGRKERLEQLEKESDRFSDLDLKGLSNQEKAEKLIKALSAEKERRIQKESAFVAMLNEERAARRQAEENMKQLEQKLEMLASVVKSKLPTKLPVIKSPQRSSATPPK